MIGRFTLPLSHSFGRGIELTENPMSKCVPLCRPTWVQGVIPVTGALFSCRSLTVTDFAAFRTRWIILTDFVSPLYSQNPSRRAPRFLRPPGIRNVKAARHTENDPTHNPPRRVLYSPPNQGNRGKWYSTHLCVGAFPLLSLF